MKMNNQDLCDASNCALEIVKLVSPSNVPLDENGKPMVVIDVWKKIEDSGKIIYAMSKNSSMLKTTHRKFVENQRDLEKTLEVSTKNQEPEKVEELTKVFNQEFKELFESGDHEVSLHKISMKNAELIAPFLSGRSKIALFEFLVMDEAK